MMKWLGQCQNFRLPMPIAETFGYILRLFYRSPSLIVMGHVGQRVRDMDEPEKPWLF